MENNLSDQIMEAKPIFPIKRILVLIFLFTSVNSFPQSFNITDFGAKADGETVNTEFIQAAIDRCSEQGGGQVMIPAGTFLSGSLFLKNGAHIRLMPGAVLKGSSDPEDYPELDIKFKTQFASSMGKILGNNEVKKFKSFIYADGVNNISIIGEGTIDGNGGSPRFKLGPDASSKESAQRPILILMVNCTKILVEGVHLRNSAYWMQNYLACYGLHIKGITVYNHCNYNNDGIDIDSKNVLIENCTVDSDDDGICLKSHDRDRLCENVVIRNCTVGSNCNAIKFGTGSVGGFRNVEVSNIIIKSASESLIRDWQKIFGFIDKPNTGLSGIAIENVDGGTTDNIRVNDIFMTDVHAAIFVKLGDRSSEGTGKLRNVMISNVTAVSHSKMTSSITGYPGHDVENIQLSNIRINSLGGGTTEDSRIVLPENEKNYPEINMFGLKSPFPSSGLFLRHVKGITLQNVTLKVRKEDYRPAIIMDDVKQVQIGSLDIMPPAGNMSPIKMEDCYNINQINDNKKDIHKN